MFLTELCLYIPIARKFGHQVLSEILFSFPGKREYFEKYFSNFGSHLCQVDFQFNFLAPKFHFQTSLEAQTFFHFTFYDPIASNVYFHQLLGAAHFFNIFHATNNKN